MREKVCVYIQLIHAAVQQKQCKAIMPRLLDIP